MNIELDLRLKAFNRSAKYGITPDAVAELTKERGDYDDIVNEPGVAQSVRKALTKGFRPAFALVEKKFKELDALILQFGQDRRRQGDDRRMERRPNPERAKRRHRRSREEAC